MSFSNDFLNFLLLSLVLIIILIRKQHFELLYHLKGSRADYDTILSSPNILEIAAVPYTQFRRKEKQRSSILDILNDDCLTEITTHLNQDDIISLGLVNKHLYQIAEKKLYRKIFVSALEFYKRSRLDNCSTFINDMSTNWTIVSPRNFDKMLQNYNLRVEFIKVVDIEFGFSNEYIRYVGWKLPFAHIFVNDVSQASRKESVPSLNPNLYAINLRNEYLKKRIDYIALNDSIQLSRGKIINLPENIVKMKITTYRYNFADIVLQDWVEIFKKLNYLHISGNPNFFFLNLYNHILQKNISISNRESQLSNLEHLVLDFNDEPRNMKFENFYSIINIFISFEILTKFDLRFSSTYYILDGEFHDERNFEFLTESTYRYMNDINRFLENVGKKLVSLKEMSLLSKDHRDRYNGYKKIKPNFKDFLNYVPDNQLKRLRLCIGHEDDFEEFKFLINKQSNSLKVIEWVGNFNNKILNDYVDCNRIKFDFTDDARRILPSYMRFRYNQIEEILNPVERRYIKEIKELAAKRELGKEIIDLKYGIKLSRSYEKLILITILQEKMNSYLNSNVTILPNLKEVYLNGVWFSVVKDFDNIRVVESIYDEGDDIDTYV